MSGGSRHLWSKIESWCGYALFAQACYALLLCIFVQDFEPQFMLQIRFQRLGRKKLPFYRIVAIDSKRRRDGIPIEVRAYARSPIDAGNNCRRLLWTRLARVLRILTS